MAETETKNLGGRPARELTAARRKLLRRAKVRLEVAEDVLAEQAAAAAADGASLRAIAEALGIARETARSLVSRGAQQ